MNFFKKKRSQFDKSGHWKKEKYGVFLFVHSDK